jgi:hypothetical protein
MRTESPARGAIDHIICREAHVTDAGQVHRRQKAEEIEELEREERYKCRRKDSLTRRMTR